MALLRFLQRLREPDFHKTTAGRRVYGLLGASLIVALGIGLLVLMIRYYRDAAAADNWLATPCTVERVDVVYEWDSVSERVEYRIDVAYGYTINGQPHRATRWTRRVDIEFKTCADAWRVASDWRDEPQRTCYVNPFDPTDAVITRGTDGYAIGFVFPVVTIAFGVLIGVSMWIGRVPGWPGIRSALSRLLPRGSPIGDRGVAIAFVAVGGLATVAIAVAVIWLRADLAKWPAVPCTVVISEEGFGSRRAGEVEREHWARVWYAYDYAGRTYRSDRHSMSAQHVSRTTRPSRPGPDAVNEHLAKLPVGMITTCYVNPRDPYVAVLHREGRAAFWWMLLPSPLLLLGVLGLIVTRRKPPRRRGAATAEDHFG